MKAVNDDTSTNDFSVEFAPIIRIDLTEEIITRIKTLLAKGVLKPGSRLPPERDFARTLGVGRPALRQALKALSTMGIIESRVGQGTFISEASSEILAAPMDFMMLLNEVTIEELFHVRKTVEVDLAGLAAERANEADLAEAKAALEGQELCLSNPEGFLAADIRFHNAIAHASRSIIFQALLKNLSRLMIENRRQLLRTEEDNLSLSFRDHVRIYEEILGRNKVGASRAMYSHLDRVYHRWLDATGGEKSAHVIG